MKTKLTVLFVILAGFTCLYPAAAQGTAFTSQDRLNFNGATAHSFYDFEFPLYAEASTNGTKIGGTLSSTGLGATNCAVIPGGSSNVVSGAFGFAAGQHAQALPKGAFVWPDSQNAAFAPTAENHFSARAKGGVVLASGSGGANQTVSWSLGAGSCSFRSDHSLKDRFVLVDNSAVLDKIAKLPVVEWNYKGSGQQHIGAMAQNFHTLFPLNDNDKVLNDADLHGVELAAIKGLNEKLQEQNRQKDAEIEALQAKTSQTNFLDKRLRALEQLVQSLAPANQ